MVATLESTPKNATHWSRASMAKRSGLSNRRSADLESVRAQATPADTFKLSNDPLFVNKVFDVVGLLNPPEARSCCGTEAVQLTLASLLNIAGGQPFSAVQILWINFLITAPVGIALGLDKETPGLMKRQPRPRAASIMTPAVITTVGLVGVFMSLAIDGLVVAGKNQYNNAEIASTMGLVAFSLMLVVAAFESRDEKASILRVDTFDNRTLNITAVVEIALAVLIARGAALTSLLGAAALTSTQWLFGALPALVLFIAWELAKAIARRRTRNVQQTVPADLTPAATAA